MILKRGQQFFSSDVRRRTSDARKFAVLFFFITVLCAFSAQAAITQVESVKAEGCPGGTCTVTFATPTTPGELVVVSIATSYEVITVTGVTDSQNSTYTNVWSYAGTEYHRKSHLYYLANAPAGITSVTVTITGHTAAGFVAAHYTGIATANPLDVYSAPNAPDDSPSWASGAVTTNQAAELLIGSDYFVHNSGSPSETSSSGSWTQDQLMVSGAFDGNNGGAFSYAHQIVSSVQTNVQNTGTNPGTVSGDNYAGIAAFKAAASGDVPSAMIRSGVIRSGRIR